MTAQNIENLCPYIDHTLLKADACKAHVLQLCHEAVEYNFAAVCINPFWVPLVADFLKQESSQKKGKL